MTPTSKPPTPPASGDRRRRRDRLRRLLAGRSSVAALGVLALLAVLGLPALASEQSEPEPQPPGPAAAARADDVDLDPGNAYVGRLGDRRARRVEAQRAARKRADDQMALAFERERRREEEELRRDVALLDAFERRAAAELAAGGDLGPINVPAALQTIAVCESGGDPRAVSPSGKYRGKYQFDQPTWEAVGGRGDPAAAPEAEQDRRAAKLFELAGPAPWPICGRVRGSAPVGEE